MLVWLGREEPADVPGVHGSLLLLGCLVVLHVIMALFYPCADVPHRVSHDFVDGGVGDEWLEEGIFGCFMEDSLY